MISSRRLTHALAPLALVLLAACQTTQTKPDATPGTTAATTPQTTAVAPTTPAAPTQSEQTQQEGAPVGIFLADTNPHADWATVEVQPNGVLYVNPTAVLTNEDLVGVQAGTGENREIGLLALDLNPEATRRLAQLTTEQPNMRLALVVGNTMLAAPGYKEPVTEGRLIFMVGTEANALAAAQAIAGEGAQANQAPAR